MKLPLVRLLLSCLAVQSAVLAAEDSAARDARMAWWREAKFGMFIHWGLYAIPADGEWHMRKNKMPLADYQKFAGEFNPTKFNADEWACLAHDAGMKYLVLTTKHHDGFAMFHSQASAYNITDATPFCGRWESSRIASFVEPLTPEEFRIDLHKEETTLLFPRGRLVAMISALPVITPTLPKS